MPNGSKCKAGAAPRRLGLIILFAAVLAVAGSCSTEEATVKVAAAANFTGAGRQIGQTFEQTTGDRVILSFGSTGQLLTQITQDAPFEVFLAADQDSPAKAVNTGFGVQGTVFTYAIGKLVLFSQSLDLSEGEKVLREGKFQKIAVANPKTAPYGAAAVEAMKSLGVYEQLAGKIVQGNNIAQAFQFVKTGNAELGFVALSQVKSTEGGSSWFVPDNLYSPLKQDAVLLKKGARNRAAQLFLAFLKSPEAAKVIESYGYQTMH